MIKTVKTILRLNSVLGEFTTASSQSIPELKNFSSPQARVAFFIFNNPNTNARKVSKRLRLDEGHISKVIGTLIKEGIVTRKQQKDDKRKYILNVTDEGKRICTAVSQVINQNVHDRLSRLLPYQIKKVDSIVEELIYYLTFKEDNGKK